MKTNDEEMTNKELQIWIACELKSFKADINGELKSFRAEVNGELNALRVEMREGFARVDARIDGVEARLGGLESRVDSLMIGVAVPVIVFVILAATK